MSETPTSKDFTWWSWVQSAKDQVISQSSEVYEFVKKDIDEFKKVVTEEASSMINSTSAALKEKLKLDEEESATNTMKKSVSGFISHVAEVFTPSPDDDDEQAILIQNQQPVFIDRLQAAIYAIQKDADTFLMDPLENKDYEDWIKSFDLKDRQDNISQLLVDSEAIHQNYQEIVPSQVLHTVFWHRYFYKVEKLKEAELKRQEISKRAEETNASGPIIWDDDKKRAANPNISEKMQNKLLEEYEKECNSNGKTVEPNRKSVKKEVTGDGSEGNSGLISSHSLDNFSSASSNLEEINEEDWEKINQSEYPDLNNCKNSPIKDSATDKSDDWENWE